MSHARGNKKPLGIGLVFLLVSSSFLVGVQLSAPVVKAYVTPDTGVVWNMDDFVANSSGAVTGGGGVYSIHQSITISTTDTLNMRDIEQVYVDAGQFIVIYVWGTLNSIGTNGILFESNSVSPQPQDWDGIIVEGGTAVFVETSIKHADTGLSVRVGGDVTLQNSYLTENYPYGVFMNDGSLIVNMSTIIASSPPPSSGNQWGGTGLLVYPPIQAPLWINESVIEGGDGVDNGNGGEGIFLLDPDNFVGIIGNSLIRGGNGGNNSQIGYWSGHGGAGILVTRVPNFDNPPGVNISHNQEIAGGDSGHNFGINDSFVGYGGVGININDNDFLGSVNISNNGLIRGGRSGDNFGDYNNTIFTGEGGRAVLLADISGVVSTLASNHIRGGHGGDNGGRSNRTQWYSAGRGGNGLEMNKVTRFLFINNEISGGDGGTNLDTGEYFLGGHGGNGIYSWLDRDVLFQSCNITGGNGGPTYWGTADSNWRYAGMGGYAAMLANSSMTIVDSNMTGGAGGDNFAQNSTGGSGAGALFINNLLGPNITGGVIRGGKGGDNFNESAKGTGWGDSAIRLYQATYVEIQGVEIYGGNGGDNYVGTMVAPYSGDVGIDLYNGTHMNIHDNPIIASGSGGIDYVDWDNASAGYTGLYVGSRSSDIQIANNTFVGHSGAGVRAEGTDVNITGNVAIGGSTGIYTWQADWINISDNQMIGTGNYALEFSQTENITVRNDRVINARYGVRMRETNNTYFNNVSVEGVSIAVYTQIADNAFFENCSISGGNYAWNLWPGTVVTLNSTFNSTSSDIDLNPASKLTVMNYLDVGVFDSTMAPISNADVQVADNGIPLYSTGAFGGTDPQTSVDGTVKWVTVTDRIYEGSNIPTENVTIATVSSPGKTFIDNGRDVDMFSSHQEAFYEYGAEIFPPEIYMVRVNGSVEIFVTAGTPVELTAVVDDSNGGNSNIASANYTRGAKTWPSGSMVALDGVFDSPIEGVWAMIDTTGWSPGRYEMWVYACDGSFCNETGDFAVINIVGDIWPPEIQNALVDGQPSQTVAAGTIVTLTATISDSLRGGSTINFANYTFGPMNWSSSVSMAPSDGGFDTSIEDVEATVNTAGWGCAVYNLYVYGSDLVGNGNATSTAYATITINVCDTLPPEVSAVAIDGQPGGATYPLSSLPPTIALTATVDDSSTGNSNIGGANYTTTVDGWPGTAMTATDGNLDSPTEGVQAVMATPSAPGSYSYFIYAWDDLTLPNYNNSAPGARLDILDDLAPRTENVLLDGAISLTINQGDPVDLTATIYDTFTGDMAIQSANYTLGAENWPGTQMNAADGAFDSSTEDVTLTLDTSAFPAGTHSVCVYGVDFGNNGNETCDNFATLTVIIPDLNPPIVSQVLANGSATFSVPQGGIVNLTASVDDTTTGDSEIVAANYTDGPGNWTSSTPMVALDGGYDSPQETVKADIDTATWTLGTHQLCVYARDASGNNNTSTQCAEINIIGMGVPPTASGSPTGVDVPLTTNITVIFSKPMNTDITNTSFTVTDFQSIWDHQDGLVTWTDGDTKMTFDPGFVLGSNTGYLVIIDGSVAEDVAGRLLDGNDDGIEGDNYTFWFRTEVYIPPDDDPPGATSPISGETDVPISTRVIAVGFDEEMDEDSVGVSINPETEIEDTSWSGNTLYIILSENLEPNTEYTIVISGATDANGNPIDVDGDGIPDPGTDLTFTFDTSSGPEAPAPAGFDMGWIVVIILAIVVVLLLLLLIKKPKPEVLKPLEEGEAIALMEEEEKELLEEV